AEGVAVGVHRYLGRQALIAGGAARRRQRPELGAAVGQEEAQSPNGLGDGARLEPLGGAHEDLVGVDRLADGLQRRRFEAVAEERGKGGCLCLRREASRSSSAILANVDDAPTRAVGTGSEDPRWSALHTLSFRGSADV